ncbi:gamma-glutamylcyclotransferase family protein [Halorubrum lipolyticum]|uniref:AIG2 family protein n=1 Tax=Halorubrum lipolyticum DSM 21995 TaxID=1227482 RepID=M0NUX7_9EURY|nr:gamma-glutamylcyclotransferase family protein [Halorubrum lipolyticum]EMA61383.1 AIG2 family protein [Halorubrum lipolyticum DSM 21995]
MDVFVYGTLTEPDRVAEVLDSYVYVGPATLFGLHLVEGRYPTLAPGGETAGRLLRTEESDALDEYEGVETGLYRRVAVPLDAPDGHPDEAAVYVGDPDRLDADAAWPGEGDEGGTGDVGDEGDDDRGFAARVDRYLERADVRVRLTP